MKIAPELQDLVVQHARREAPNECCGLVAMRDGVAYAVHELPNLTPSPFRFTLDSPQFARLLFELEDAGDWYAIYHSHTRSAPLPSQTDITYGRNWPGVEWLIVGLAGERPELRSFLIDGQGAVIEAGVD